MRMMIGLVAAMLWAAPALAADWFLVEKAEDGTTAIFVDRDSIADMGIKTRRASVVYVPDEPGDDGAAGYRATLEYDCADPRYRFIDIDSLDIDGKRTASFPGSRNWRDIVAGTLDDTARKFVCSNGEEPSGTRSYGAELPVAAGVALLRDDAPKP